MNKSLLSLIISLLTLSLTHGFEHSINNINSLVQTKMNKHIVSNDISGLISDFQYFFKFISLFQTQYCDQDFLKEQSYQLNQLVIIEGIIDGLSQNKSTKCLDGFVNNKEELSNLIADLIDDILSGTNIIKAFIKALSQFKKHFSSLITDCRVNELITIVNQLINNPEVLDQFLDRIADNIGIIEEIGNDIVIAIRNSDDLNIGRGIGKIIRIALNFYVY